MSFASFLAKLLVEVVDESCKSVLGAELFFDCGDVCKIFDDLEHAASGSDCHDFIRLEPQREFSLLKDLVHCADALHCKCLLPKIVVCLHDDLH